MHISSTKTEHRALNALESIIDDHSTMEHQFNAEDKEMSWDGYISIYKVNSGEQSKRNFDSRVPVQIKGHNDDKKAYINKKCITYAVDLDDLEAYASEKGVLYFQIFITEAQREIFYASLYPSKIADYLDLAHRRHNGSCINIAFSKLEKDSDKLYLIVKQFAEEAKRQGSAFTPLVQDRIRCNEFDKLTSITLSAVGVKNNYDALKRLSTGDICLYGKTEGDKYDRPLEWLNNSKFFIGTEVRQPISINGEVFYEKYNCIEDSDGGIVLKISPNLEMRLKEGVINFKIKSSIKELLNDARFLLKLCAGNAYYVNGQAIRYTTDIGADKEFVKRLEYIVDLCETLQMIGFDINGSLDQFTDEEKEQLTRLVNLRLGAFNGQIKEELSKYSFKLGDKILPLLIIKRNDEIELQDAVYTDKYVIFLPDNEKPEEKGYKMPLFVYQGADVLSNLYRYDYTALQKQIDDCDINEKTATALLEATLIMINTYDASKDVHFLDLAQSLLEKIKVYLEPELYMLNTLQIKKRKVGFGSAEIEMLNTFDMDENHIMYGKYVLLGDKEKADLFFDQFSQEEKEQYYKYPIYSLYRKL